VVEPWGRREAEMKKLVISTVVLAVAVLALRRFGPALGQKAMKKCEEMFDHMPEDFPPKRMIRGIDEIREQSARIVHDLEEAGPVLAAASRR
jgi:hypothetical protein